jgi:hypothetical protein
MKRAFKVINLLCILLVLGLVFGCSKDSDPVVPDEPIIPDEPDIVGSIGIFADPDGTDQDILDTGGVVTVYVYHQLGTDGATASAFTVEAPANWTLMSEQVEFPLSIGNVDEGIAIAYGGCRTGDIHLMTLIYRSAGNSPEGSVFSVRPHPHTPEYIEVVDCENKMQSGTGMDSPVVQPDIPDPVMVGSIGVFADPDGLDQNIVDTGGLVTLYVVHKLSGNEGAKASAFTIESPAGWDLQAANVEFPLSIGDINDGISIPYGYCLGGNIHLMTLYYMSPGNSLPGTVFRVRPHPNTPDHIEVVDCEDHMQGGTGVETPVIQQ